MSDINVEYDELGNVPLMKGEPKRKDLSELNDYLANILEIDEINLDVSIKNNSKIFFKIQQELQIQTRSYIFLSEQFDTIKKNRRLYYDGRLPANYYTGENAVKFPPKNQTELNELLKTDNYIIGFNRVLKQAEQRVNLCEKALEQQKYRGVEIRTIIDYRKMMEGLN